MTGIPDISQIVDATDSGIIILDDNARIMAWNNWLIKYTGRQQTSVINKSIDEVFDTDINKSLSSAIDEALHKGRSTFLSPRLHKHPLPLYRDAINKESHKCIYQKVSVSSLTIESTKRYCMINIHDVTASVNRENTLKAASKKLKISEQRIRHLAFHDPLTSLANRSLFADRLDMAIENAIRDKELISVMLIDLDYFKQINDRYGHDSGDSLLVEISNRIQSCIRSSDTAARLGGDEFAIIQTKIKSLNLNSISSLADKLNEAFSKPIKLNNITIQSGASIGVSVFPMDADNSSDLLKNADLAMYNAKLDGRSNWQFYSEEMRSEIKLRQEQKDKLSSAINDNRIIVHYQPEISLKNKCINTLEALVRYIDESGKIVMPNDFILVAEESNLINSITSAVLHDVCNMCKNWKSDYNPDISINLSSKQFRDDELMNQVIETHEYLKKYNFKIELEVTESILMENFDYAASMLEMLSNMGISIAIDDFGTGYSSFEYLKRFPIHKLKIDKSFIDDVCKSHNDEIITNAMISLGHNLNMIVVAEGVENKDQVDFLINKGCDIAQGYFYSKPISETEIHKFINKKQAA